MSITSVSGILSLILKLLLGPFRFIKEEEEQTPVVEANMRTAEGAELAKSLLVMMGETAKAKLTWLKEKHIKTQTLEGTLDREVGWSQPCGNYRH